jgi:hypothetical protein
LTEYFVVSDGGVYFVLTRRETPATDGGTRVDGKRFAVTVDCDGVLDDGTVSLAVHGEIPKEELPDSTFSVTEHFRIKRDNAKATLQFLDVRMGKAE